MKLKEEIKSFWDGHPSGAQASHLTPGTLEFFEEVERYRYEVEPFIHSFAQFPQWRGKRVLEVGCGMGTDLLQFARAGAEITGIDRSTTALDLARKRLELYKVKGEVREADAETLPFSDSSFDLVYSWGVIHHTPNTEKAVEEIYRVLKPAGRILIMIYHKYSWAVLHILMKYGVLKGELVTRGFRETISRHTETTDEKNPLTKVYSIKEARELFSRFDRLSLTVCVTASDGTMIPSIVKNIFSPWIGWYLMIRGEKPAKGKKD